MQSWNVTVTVQKKSFFRHWLLILSHRWCPLWTPILPPKFDCHRRRKRTKKGERKVKTKGACDAQVTSSQLLALKWWFLIVAIMNMQRVRHFILRRPSSVKTAMFKTCTVTLLLTEPCFKRSWVHCFWTAAYNFNSTEYWVEALEIVWMFVPLGTELKAWRNDFVIWVSATIVWGTVFPISGAYVKNSSHLRLGGRSNFSCFCQKLKH